VREEGWRSQFDRRVPLFIGRGGAAGCREGSTTSSSFQGSEGASEGPWALATFRRG
jgi:hypothetical protein